MVSPDSTDSMGLFELIYYVGYRAKTAYDLSRRKRLPAKVISVGNLTVGGTGKTPVTLALAEEAIRRGHRPCVLTRGYRGRLKGTVLVRPDMAARDVGDEPLLIASRLTGVHVIKDADRYRGGMYALMRLAPVPDLFILDDGFQHRRLHRDIDVLLLDANNPFDNRKLLPMGRLREPLKEMRRAGVILVTKCEGGVVGEGLMTEIRKYNPGAPVFAAGYEANYVREPGGARLPLDTLVGRRVFAFSGIAAPVHFVDMLKRAGADVVGHRGFRDHYAYSVDDLEELGQDAERRSAEWIMTTEKDIMRLKGPGLPPGLMALGVRVRIEEGFYDYICDLFFT